MLFTIIAMIVLMIYIISYYAFVLPKQERTAFRLFELRDMVALEAINGNISEEAIEYKFIIAMINNQIRFVDRKIPYTRMFASAFSVEDSAVDEIIELIKKNEVLSNVFDEINEIYKKQFKYKKYIIRYLYVFPISKMAGLLLLIIKKKKHINKKRKKMERREICKYRDDVKKNYGIMEKVLNA